MSRRNSSGSERSKEFPNVPTMQEAGLNGFEIVQWHAMYAPKGTPKDAIARLNAAAIEAMADPAVQKAYLGETV